MLRKTNNMRKILGYLASACILVFCISSFFSLKRLKNAKADTFVSYPKITNAYSQLFSEKASSLLTPSYTFYNKHKNPIATFNVLGDNYQLIVYRMSNVIDLPIRQIVQLKLDGREELSTNSTYDISIKSRTIQFADANMKPEAVSRLYFKIDGEIKEEPSYSDSTVYFRLNINRLSAQYEPKGAVMFSVYKKRTLLYKKAPIEVLFQKKGTEVYLFLLSLKNAEELPAEQNFIFSLLAEPV